MSRKGRDPIPDRNTSTSGTRTRRSSSPRSPSGCGSAAFPGDSGICRSIMCEFPVGSASVSMSGPRGLEEGVERGTLHRVSGFQEGSRVWPSWLFGGGRLVVPARCPGSCLRTDSGAPLRSLNDTLDLPSGLSYHHERTVGGGLRTDRFRAVEGQGGRSVSHGPRPLGTRPRGERKALRPLSAGRARPAPFPDTFPAGRRSWWCPGNRLSKT